jgi:hypothetical protein
MTDWLDPQLPGTVLERERVVPNLRLPESPSGITRGLHDFRGRKSLILPFLHSGCERCKAFVADLASHEQKIRQSDGEVRVVLDAAEETAFPVLVDAEQQARRALLGPETALPAILVLDRDSAAYESHPVSDHSFPDAGEVAGTLWHLSIMCPECGD